MKLISVHMASASRSPAGPLNAPLSGSACAVGTQKIATVAAAVIMSSLMASDFLARSCKEL